MPAFKMACVPWGWKLKKWWRCASLPAGRSMFRCITPWLLFLLPHSPFPMEDVVLIHSISRFLLLLRDSSTRRWNIAYLFPWPPDSFCVTRLRQMGAELSPVCYHLSTAVQGQLEASCSPLRLQDASIQLPARWWDTRPDTSVLKLGQSESIHEDAATWQASAGWDHAAPAWPC